MLSGVQAYTSVLSEKHPGSTVKGKKTHMQLHKKWNAKSCRGLKIGKTFYANHCLQISGKIKKIIQE